MKIRIEEINGEKIIIINNPISNELVKINASIGGMLISLQLSDGDSIQELIAIPAKKSYSLSKNPYYPSGLLMPWVNRVRNGNYSFKGKNYQLPINETKLGNAIHGFMAHAYFEIISEEEKEDFASVCLKHQSDGTFPGYPFSFECILTYTFHSNGDLNFNITCKNTGEKEIPFATGWHPYFQLGNNIEDSTLYFHSIEKYLSDSQMIPLSAEPFFAQNGISLKIEKPDNVYLLQKSKSNSVALVDHKQKRKLCLEFNSEIFPYFIAFCPEGENCIALEPMTGNTDCFNTFEGLIELSSQEEFTGDIKISLNKIGQN